MGVRSIFIPMTVAFLTALSALAQASPFKEVKAQDELYRRVQALGAYGLLDGKDASALAQGKPVTRLQLALFTEKAKARLDAGMMTAPKNGEMVLAAHSTSSGQAAPAQSPSLQVSQEIDALLKALRKESLYLRSRLDYLNHDLDAREREMTALKNEMIKVEGVMNKANRKNGSPNLYSYSTWQFEDLTLKSAAPASVPLSPGTPVTSTARLPNQRITTWSQGFDVGVWASFGPGSISSGFNCTVLSDHGPDDPVSIYLSRPRIDLNLDTRLGKGTLYILKEAYDPNTSIGEFTRSGGGGMRRYEHPFVVQKYNDNKSGRVWEDYVHNLGFVDTQAVVGGNVQSTGDKVFDGLLFNVQEVPLAGEKARARVLAGRMKDPNQFEYAFVVSRPWLSRDRLGTNVSAIWVDQADGVKATSPNMDMRCYSGTFTINLAPLGLIYDASWSRFWTGYYDTNNDDLSDAPPPTLRGVAGRATASLYPLNIVFTHIQPEYSNFQSKVTLTGVDYQQMGQDFADPGADVGDSETLQSNRRSWRANLGWNGRREAWMKERLPEFLDWLVLNFNFARKQEYLALSDSTGNYSLAIPNQVTFYCAEDQGIWGKHVFGGFDTPKPVRYQFMSNILQARGDPVTATDDFPLDIQPVLYGYGTTREIIPLVDPATLQKLSHLKTYHYMDVANKWQLNRFLGWSHPLYLGVFYSDTSISGKAQEEGQADIDKMFEIGLWDVALMVGRVLPYVNVMAHVAQEKWKSDYSYPRVDCTTDQKGLGLSYDFPWGGGSLETRYEHLKYRSVHVPANDYDGEQLFAKLKLRF